MSNLNRHTTFGSMIATPIDRIYEQLVSCGLEYCTDSRLVKAGAFFFCLRGDRYDANDLVGEILQKGAAFVVTDNPEFAKQPSVLWVEDSLVAFQQVAAFHAAQLGIQFVAVGGSNGKTSTKELIHRVLSLKYNVYATPGNFNNHVGVPMTLLALRPEHDVAVVELGTNHPGEMKELCALFAPHIGVITNIGKEHLEGFGTVEAVAREESELYLRLQECGGKAMVNADDAWLENMSKRLTRVTRFGITHSSVSIKGQVIQAMPKLEYELHIEGLSLGRFCAELGGSYNLYNILAAIAIGVELGIAPEKAAEQCGTYVPTNNRSQWIQTSNTLVYLDAYNANPSSMRASLADFMTLQGSKALLLGDMFELGETEIQEHKELLDWLWEQESTDLYLCGSRFKQAAGSFPMVFDTADALLAWLDTHPIEVQYAFIKGSRGMKMEKALEHFQGLS